jgi:hypothetical protein
MKTNQNVKKRNLVVVKLSSAFGLVALMCFLASYVAVPTHAQAKTATPSQKGKLFASPDEAVDALIDAAQKYDENGLKEILGPDSYDLIHTGEPVADKETVTNFATAASAKKAISYNPTKTRASLNIGEDGWPFPIPIAKQGTKWYFDTAAGRQEILNRRIGQNELDAINICEGYVEAQNQYALEKHDDATVNQYAQRIISTPGKHDGLAWQNADGTWGGSVGDKAAKEIEKTYTGTPAPYHGYYFKILKGQGPAAPLGQLDYVIKGAMIGGFALIAYPSAYRGTGVKTFMVSQDGVVWSKDLGPNTRQAAQAIDRFNPDKSWAPDKDQ